MRLFSALVLCLTLSAAAAPRRAVSFPAHPKDAPPEPVATWQWMVNWFPSASTAAANYSPGSCLIETGDPSRPFLVATLVKIDLLINTSGYQVDEVSIPQAIRGYNESAAPYKGIVTMPSGGAMLWYRADHPPLVSGLTFCY